MCPSTERLETPQQIATKIVFAYCDHYNNLQRVFDAFSLTWSASVQQELPSVYAKACRQNLRTFNNCNDIWSTAHTDVTFKTSNFLLISTANSHDQRGKEKLSVPGFSHQWSVKCVKSDKCDSEINAKVKRRKLLTSRAKLMTKGLKKKHWKSKNQISKCNSMPWSLGELNERCCGFNVLHTAVTA